MASARRRPGPGPGRVTGPGPVEVGITDALRAFTTEMDRYIDTHGAPHGLYRTDLYALSHLIDAARRGREVTPGTLAAALNLSAPATSAMLGRLESAGHVHRRHGAADRRRVVVEMTDDAMAVGAQIFAPIGRAMSTMLAGYTQTERETVLRFLTDTVAATRRASGADDGSQ